jgi:hypothetical protein
VSDARWIEIDKAVASAVDNLTQGLAFARHPDFHGSDLIGSALRMGFMHAIQVGQTSLENATRPGGDSWHADLIARVARGTVDRPAILPPELPASADETRRFRNRATRAYDNFDADRSTPTIGAAASLAKHLPDAIAAFRAMIDPQRIAVTLPSPASAARSASQRSAPRSAPHPCAGCPTRTKTKARSPPSGPCVCG